VIHLDTTFVIDLLREARKSPGPATQLLTELADQPLAISVFVLCELYAGAELSDDPSKERKGVQKLCAALILRVPDEKLALLYGQELATLQRSGRSVGTMDLLIAASALADGSDLVTRNLDHFQRFQGLRIRSY
jgi:predicted nucleic acid-binding protein